MIMRSTFSRLCARFTAGCFLVACANGAARADNSASSYFIDDFLKNSEFSSIYASMVQFFPKESQIFQEQVHMQALQLGIDRSDRYTNAEIEQLKRLLSSELDRFYASHNDYAYNATDAALRDVIQSRVQMIKSLQGSGNDCNTFLIYGPKSDMINTDIPYNLLTTAASMNFRAMYEGSIATTNRPRSETFSYELHQHVTSGMSEAEIALISSPDINDPQTCTAFIKFFEGIWRAQGEEAVVFRADLVSMMLQ
ncbi:hypothetical protein [Loktanella salsilacus]|uniref:hypothetical protein n=1 Tax=Loktanella salsilacus TaxID=195913 RepID=UPI003735E1A9